MTLGEVKGCTRMLVFEGSSRRGLLAGGRSPCGPAERGGG